MQKRKVLFLNTCINIFLISFTIVYIHNKYQISLLFLRAFFVLVMFLLYTQKKYDTLTKGNENDPNGLGNKPRDVEQIMSKLSNTQILQ